MTITLVDENAPTAEAGAGQAVRTGSSVTLDGSASRDGETTLTYSWALTGNPDTVTVNLSSATAEMPTFTAPATPTELTFTLTVTDEGDNTNTDTVTVAVRSEVNPPTAEAGDDRRVSPGSAVTLDGSGSTDDVAVATYLWVQTGGTNVSLAAPNTATPSFTPMEPGRFTFTLTATDAAGNSDTDTVTITAAGAGDRIVLYPPPNQFSVAISGIALDGDHLLQLDLRNLNRLILSSRRSSRLADLPSGNESYGIVIGGEQALITSWQGKAIWTVELDDGAHTLLSRGGDDAMGTGDAFDTPWGLALDSGNNRVFVTDIGLDAIVSVSLATATLGNRTILSRGDSDPDDGSDTSVGSGAIAFDSPYAIVLDSTNNRLLVADDGLDAIVAVSLASGTQGNRSIFSRGGSSAVGSGDAFETPHGLALDSANNRLLVTDTGLNAIVAVALDTGNRSILSGGEAGIGSGEALRSPESIVLDSTNERLLVADYSPILLNDIIIGFRSSSIVAVYLTDPEDPAE